MEIYKPRLIDGLLKRKLMGTGAVLIEGLKWCGKTTTAEQHSNSVIYMDDPVNKNNNIKLAETDPQLLLSGATPRLIDEWQIAPELWNAVRFRVDHKKEEGQFILTGSAVPQISEEIKKTMHTGTGRIARLKMRTMSLWESGDSNGAVSLQEILNGKKQTGVSTSNLSEIAYLCCRGGWPKATLQDRTIALDRAEDYYQAIVNFDIARASRMSINRDRIKRLLRSYARLQGSQTSVNAITADMKSGESDTLDSRTVQNYIDTLKQIYVIEDMPAWNPNLRSKSAIRTTETRYFSDPSIATSSLSVGPEDLINDLNTFGFIFETMCVRDLRVYAESLGGEVYHFRDSNGLECDLVIHFRNGKYGLIEIKLGGDKLIEEGVKNLLKLKNTIDTNKMGDPSFMMVITATGQFAFQRSDGVYIVPINTLKN
ncbi:MAG: ATP-binding protein [Muribaculaceae bacterium]|nr:ATP-binding protein [Muribaculaceae bacterium]